MIYMGFFILHGRLNGEAFHYRPGFRPFFDASKHPLIKISKPVRSRIKACANCSFVEIDVLSAATPGSGMIKTAGEFESERVCHQRWISGCGVLLQNLTPTWDTGDFNIEKKRGPKSPSRRSSHPALLML
jgi:hypothetical protein